MPGSMRLLFLLLVPLVCASVADAQVSRPAAPTTGQRVILVVGAVGGGMLAAPLVGPFAPIGVAVGTYGTSAALGFDPSLRGVAFETLVGTAAGVAAAAAVYVTATEVGDADTDLSAAIGAGAVGLVVGAAVTGGLHGRGLAARAERGAVGLAPVALVAPTGEPGAGLALRIGL